MNTWGLGLIIASIMSSTAAFLWIAWKIDHNPKKSKGSAQTPLEAAETDVEHIFNDEFRQELRNRGRLHFEKIIGENAMFLQQDLRLTTSQLNEYMKAEITRKLQEEFAKYEESITDAKELAIDSINKTQAAIEEQRQVMSQQLKKEFETEKQRQIQRFSDNMAEIVNHYIMAAIGNQIDLNDQLEYIIGEMQTNKEAIIQDIADGS